MTDVSVLAVPDVDATGPVVHLAWAGPSRWLYAPDGWHVLRRIAGRQMWACSVLNQDQLATLRADQVLRIAPALVHWRAGSVPQPLAGAPSHQACEIFTFDLDAASDYVRVLSTGKTSWAYGLRNGHVIATSPAASGNVNHFLTAPGIDRVVLYVQVPTSVGLCTGLTASGTEWREIALLRLPLHETDPALVTRADERAAARARLLPGETVTDDELDALANMLRPIVRSRRPPGLLSMWLTGENSDPVELAAIEPLRAALAHPRWRRALGFAYSDRDPGLVVGQRYEYMVAGGFPAWSIRDAIHGFQTAPAGTLLPSTFSIGDVRISLPRPTAVETLVPANPVASPTLTRRAITLSPDRDAWWLQPGIDGWSAVIDLPEPVTSIVLELGEPTAGLTWEATAPDNSSLPAHPVPAEATPRLVRTTPFIQVRLSGRARLCAIRRDTVPPDAKLPAQGLTPPVLLAATPPPAPPSWIAATSLQAPLVIATDPDAPIQPRHDLGFTVTWMPSTGVTAWPPDLPPPPLESTAFELEHRTTTPMSAWDRVIEEDVVLGDRGSVTPPALVAGGDLMLSFPEQRTPSPGFRPMRFVDAFDHAPEGTVARRPTPVPGGMHQYRVRAVDLVGRTSAAWTESAAVRLEKHDPPPAPVGVTSRVLIANDPTMSAQEVSRLGAHANVVIMRWGWYAEQRRRDPSAREFRVYVRRDAFDHIAGSIDAVSTLGPGQYSVTITLAGPIAADVSRGLRIEPGYPFEIATHTGAGSGAITAMLVTRVPGPGAAYPVPVLGPIQFPLRLDPVRGRPAAWGPRVAIVPITDAETYEIDLSDLLTLSPAMPKDRVMVGISAADGEAYIPDPLAPLDSRPGNEGAVVATTVTGEWKGRPELVDGPALVDVPSIKTPEPRAQPIAATLDVRAFLTDTGLPATDPLAFERVRADDVLRAYRTEAGKIVAVPPDPIRAGESPAEISVGNAGDRAAIAAALSGTERMADRYVVYLAARHPQRDRMFVPVGTGPMVPAALRDTLPERGGRWIYRARLVDAAGRRSASAVVLRGIVRVPAGAPTGPGRDAAQPGDPLGRLRLRLDDRDDLGPLAVFVTSSDFRDDASGASLLRIPGRGIDALRLRLPDGRVIAPLILPTAGAGIGIDSGARRIAFDGPWPSATVRVWAASTTIDGVASELVGPWRLLLGAP